MTMDNAQQFVARMRMDQEFREAVKATAGTAELRQLLDQSGYDFSERDLVGAMASCMEEMARMDRRE
jgi:predicted ribosomally synthesized peptide with nif11-like leader